MLGSGEPEHATSKLSLGDSIGLVALVVALITLAVTPPFGWRVGLLAASIIGFFIFSSKSHWTNGWSRRPQITLAVGATGLLILAL